jgi:hypothetical protein
MGCQHGIPGPIIIIRTGHGGDGPDQRDFALTMPAIEFHDNRMILVKIGLHSVASVAGDERTVQPLVRVQQHRGHTRSVGAIQDLFVNLGHPLP